MTPVGLKPVWVGWRGFWRFTGLGVSLDLGQASLEGLSGESRSRNDERPVGSVALRRGMPPGKSSLHGECPFSALVLISWSVTFGNCLTGTHHASCRRAHLSHAVLPSGGSHSGGETSSRGAGAEAQWSLRKIWRAGCTLPGMWGE